MDNVVKPVYNLEKSSFPGCGFVENRVDGNLFIKKMLSKDEIKFVINPQKGEKERLFDGESYVYRRRPGLRNLPLYARLRLWYDRRASNYK